MKTTLSALLLMLFSSTVMANTYNCKASSYVKCDSTNCGRESTNSVEFTIDGTKADIAMYSVIVTDHFAVIRHSKDSVGFLLNANGNSVSGEFVEILASGHIFPDKKFSALIGGVHYQGTCQ